MNSKQDQYLELPGHNPAALPESRGLHYRPPPPPSTQGSNLDHGLSRNLKCMHRRQKNNRSLPYDTSQKMRGP